jgi:hypothetical protein
VVADGESLQISQALAANEDSEHGNQQQISGREPQAAPHPRIWDQPQIADQIEIGSGGCALKHGKTA